jgi:hypothetical protein
MVGWLLPTMSWAGPLEIGLGGGAITNRAVATAGSLDASMAVFPDPIVGLDLRASTSVRLQQPVTKTLLAWIGGAEGELLVAVPESARWVEVVQATDLAIASRLSLSAALVWRP